MPIAWVSQSFTPEYRTPRVGLIGYCLMSNHVHLVVTPHNTDGLGLALRHTHGRYAIYWNAAHQSSGHAWQGRYYSCPLDRVHLWEALRYTELNPVRAGLAGEAEAWAWSSAAAHRGAESRNEALDLELWRKSWTASAWRQYLAAGEMESKLTEIRRCTHTGRPLGSAEFVQALEGTMKRIRQGNAPVVLLGLVLDLSDERSSIGKEAAESGRGGEASCGV